MKKCSNCNKLYGDSDFYCIKCNHRLTSLGNNEINNYDKSEIERINKHEENINSKNTNTPKKISGQVICPYCGSTQIQLVGKKWSVTTGFLTNKVDRVCVNCKKKF